MEHGSTGPADGALATVVSVPRERFAYTQRSLESIFACTEQPYELVVVDGRSPRTVRRYLEQEAVRRGFTLIRADRYLSPNQARNIGLGEVRTRYAVFVDNDLIVTPGWLSRLVRCAEDTGAWVVGPLYFEGDPADERVHMAGGDITITGHSPHRTFAERHRCKQQLLHELDEPIVRAPVDYVEFHCMLVRADAFDRIGPLDENLVSTREHLDVCMTVREAGGSVWLEPDARVTYRAPPPFESVRDVPFFWVRWSDAWATSSLEHFCRKYGIDASYTERVRQVRWRRQLVFTPLRRATRRTLGSFGDRAVGKVLATAETGFNRLVVRSPRPRPPRLTRVT